MRKFFLFSFFALLFMGTSPSAWAKRGVIIQKVINGETVELSDGRRVRLIGVKTNEIQPILEKRFHLSLSQMADLNFSQLTEGSVSYIENRAVGKTVTLSFDSANEKRQHKDLEGRTLAYIWYVAYSQGSADAEGSEKIFGVKSQNQLLNQELVQMGLALVDDSSPFLQQESFLGAEKNAARGRAGFWRSAALLYGDLLAQAKEEQAVSTAGFVAKDYQKISLESSRKKLTELINLNPKNYRPYYERSWLGANPVHDKISDGNLLDIHQALEISSFNPKCYMQKSYLLALKGDYDESSRTYSQMIDAGGKMGMAAFVTEMSREKLSGAPWSAWTKMPEAEFLILDALRATLNEDHFLLFMARYKSYGDEIPEIARKVYEEVSSAGRFPVFLKKHSGFLSRAEPHELIYRTQWALRGHAMPEDVMRWMETIGEAVLVKAAGSDKDAIDMTGREEEGAKKEKPPSETLQSEAKFL